MKELVVISGKGGTGKTSITASLAVLAGARRHSPSNGSEVAGESVDHRASLVMADCDVDAADLHLILQPDDVRCEEFSGGSEAWIDPTVCTGCARCVELCRFDAIRRDDQATRNRHVNDPWLVYRVDPLACEGCGVCVDHCPAEAIRFEPGVNGHWFVAESRAGPMLHARLTAGAENSGKLVTLLRRAARELAAERGIGLVLCDGSPGIGCPVIASLTGASLALMVVEPTVSGRHDFERVARLTRRLGVPAVLAINKADLNHDVAASIEQDAAQWGIEPLGRVPYDPEVTRAMVDGRSVVETSTGPAAEAISRLWAEVRLRLEHCRGTTADGLIGLDD